MDITIKQGETFRLIVNEDETAEELRFIVANSEHGIVVDETVLFTTVEGVNQAEIEISETFFDVDEYNYSIIITLADGTIKKLPEENCDDCDFPKFNVCKGFGNLVGLLDYDYVPLLDIDGVPLLDV